MYSLVEISLLNAVTAGALALVVLLVSRFLRRPAVIHALWILVLVKLVTPPMVEIPVGLRFERLASLSETVDRSAETASLDKDSASATTAPVIVVSETIDRFGEQQPIGKREGAAVVPGVIARNSTDVVDRSAATDRFRRWLSMIVPILLWIWISGTIAWFVIHGCWIVRFMRFISEADPASDDVQRQAGRLASKIGAGPAPDILVVRTTMTPILWAVGCRARIIFPAAFLDRVDEAARATLLMHELAHYRRRDHWVRLLELVVTGLFWWHPVVWIARREIENSEEHCCDAWVVSQFPNETRRYAEALLDTIDFLSEDRPRPAPVASGLGQATFLRDRIRTIISGVAPKSMSGTTRIAMFAVAALLLPLGPQLFDGTIRRADAVLVVPEPNSPMDMPLSMQPEFSGTVSPHTFEEWETDGASSEQSVDRLEDKLFAPSTPDAAVWAVVNSPDGRFQAIARTNRGLVLWDTFQRRTFDLTDYQISSIAFVPHRDLLAAGSSDSSVYLFDCATGEPIATFTKHQAAVGSVAVSLDGRFVVSGSRDGVVRLWDVEYGKEAASRVPVQSSAISCVRFSPDGRLVAIASGGWTTSSQGAVVVWDLRGGMVRQRFNTPSPVGALAFGTEQLVIAQWDGRATSWDLQSGTADGSGIVSKDTVSAAAFAADAQALLLTTAGGELASGMKPPWFERMDRDHDQRLAWNEFQGSLGTFRMLDADSNEMITWDEVNAIQ